MTDSSSCICKNKDVGGWYMYGNEAVDYFVEDEKSCFETALS